MGDQTFHIGICVKYAQGTYTLAGVRFSHSGVFLWTPTGGQHRLRSGKNWDPHFSYHPGRISHLVSYGEYRYERVRQALGATFSGFEPLVVQGFGREDARSTGRPCEGFDACLAVEADVITEKEDVVVDHMGTVKTPLPTAYLAVDLVEACQDGPAIAQARNFHRSVIRQALITDALPWCLLTVGHSFPGE